MRVRRWSWREASPLAPGPPPHPCEVVLVDQPLLGLKGHDITADSEAGVRGAEGDNPRAERDVVGCRVLGWELTGGPHDGPDGHDAYDHRRPLRHPRHHRPRLPPP